MGRLSALPLALLAVAALALALSACGGGSDAELLPGTTASEITSNLDEVRDWSPRANASAPKTPPPRSAPRSKTSAASTRS